MAPAVESFIDLPPWPTGWTDWTVTVTTREMPGNPRLQQLVKQGGLRFSGIYHGDAIFRLDDVFFCRERFVAGVSLCLRWGKR
jgi:hypothetical protein